MNNISRCKRYSLKNTPLIYNQFFQVQYFSSKKDDESENKNTADQKTNKEALNKLNLLLKQIVQNDAVNVTSNLKLARPKLRKAPVKDDGTKNVKSHTIDKDVISSIKSVAKSLSGNVKQTESELLSKLLSSDINIGSNPISTNLSDIVKGMKIEKNKPSTEELSRAQQVRSILKESEAGDRDETTKSKYIKNRSTYLQVDSRDRRKINLFGQDPLNIFSDISQYTESEKNETWQKLYDRDLQLVVTHPPTNYFQQMILWTEQGKLWKFPIDNEQSLEEEQNISFTEHVFLEKHLEHWCPPKGPIRHFMELVCVGLSKNPYMSAKRKQEHIEWYKHYFEDKSKLLEEVGAIPVDFKQKDEQTSETKDVKY